MLSATEDASESRRMTLGLRILVILGLLVAPTVTTGLFYHLIQRQDSIAQDERLRQAAGLLAFFADVQNVAVADNATWDEAYQQIVAQRDYDWFQRNIGAVQFGTMPHDAAAVISADGRTLAGSYLGEEAPWAPAETLGPAYEALVDRLVAEPDAGPLGSFVSDGEQIGYLAVAELQPETDAALPERALLLFYYLLDEGRLADWREVLSWDDLSVSTELAGGAGLPIRDALGRTIGSFRWVPPLPGTRAFGEMAPVALIAVAFGVVAILGLYSQALKVARRLVAARRDALELACRDPLTGVANRRLLAREIDAALERGGPFQVIIFDLDGFKAINDMHGHQAGDEVLVALSKRLGDRIEGGGLLARMGGDEFAIVRYGPDAGVGRFAEQICEDVASPVQVAGQVTTLSASVGIAAACEGLAGEEIVRRADLAIYAAKTNRPGTIRLYDDVLDFEARREAELGRAMRAGLARGEFYVAYQPVLSVAERRVTAVEALLRWQHPTEGQIPPDVFIPVAERSGFISELGQFVLSKACGAFATTDLKVAVNLSPVQLLDPRLLTAVSSVLQSAGFDPRRLEFEVTETMLIGQPLHAAKVMEELRRSGIGIALDDFGAGYASIGYVRRFPLDKIKIDRSLIATIAQDHAARDVVAAIIALCRALRVEIAAEGVETVAQAELLSEMGCNLLQGWHIGRPSPAVCPAIRQVA